MGGVDEDQEMVTMRRNIIWTTNNNGNHKHEMNWRL
jgi:hypothetical protein